MRIKLLCDVDGTTKDAIVDCADERGKTLIEAKQAIEYTEEIELKEKEDIKLEIKKEVAKTFKKEVKMSIEPEVKSSGIEVVKDCSGDWKGMGEFLKAVMHAEEKHIVDPRLIQKASTGIGEDNSGGYLVQHPLWNQEIFKSYMQSAVIAPKCRNFVAAEYANGLKFKQIAETTRSATSTWGGVRFYNVDEGSDITQSGPVFQQKDVSIVQIGALYYLTQALVDDCPNISEYVAGIVGESFGRAIDNEIMNGSLSAFTPTVGHLSTVAVTVAGANPTAAEWLSIYNAVGPSYRNRAEFYVSTKTYAGLLALATPILATGGLTGIPLVQPDFTQPGKLLLFGRPVNVMETMTAQGTAGNIIFADFSNYGLVTKGSLMPKVAMSLHVKWLSNQQCWRFIARCGGSPLIYSKVTLEDTSVISWAASRN